MLWVDMQEDHWGERWLPHNHTLALQPAVGLSHSCPLRKKWEGCQISDDIWHIWFPLLLCSPCRRFCTWQNQVFFPFLRKNLNMSLELFLKTCPSSDNGGDTTKGFSLAGVLASEGCQNICLKSVLVFYSSRYASESKTFCPLMQNHAFSGHNQCIHSENFQALLCCLSLCLYKWESLL